MESYNYLEIMTKDVIEAIYENKEYWADFDNMDRLDKECFLYDKLFCDDSVTGNASGSYFFSDYKSKQAVADNMDLLIESYDYFGGDLGDAIRKGWEHCDVAIRCYILSQAISEALNQLEA